MPVNEKCTISADQRKIILCDGISEAMDKGLGDIQIKSMIRFSDRLKRDVMVIGRFKKSQCQVAYCPACGNPVSTGFPSSEELRKEGAQ